MLSPFADLELLGLELALGFEHDDPGKELDRARGVSDELVLARQGEEHANLVRKLRVGEVENLGPE